MHWQKHSMKFRNTLLKLHTQTHTLNWWGNQCKPSYHHFSSSSSFSLPPCRTLSALRHIHVKHLSVYLCNLLNQMQEWIWLKNHKCIFKKKNLQGYFKLDHFSSPACCAALLPIPPAKPRRGQRPGAKGGSPASTAAQREPGASERLQPPHVRGFTAPRCPRLCAPTPPLDGSQVLLCGLRVPLAKLAEDELISLPLPPASVFC